MIVRARLILLALAPLLGGCPGHIPTTSISGSECKVFEGPEYEVLGRSKYDQHWIDSTVEGGVGACRWSRPAARPPELDAAPASQPKAAVKAAKKPGLIRRIKQRVWPKASIAPIVVPPASPDRPVAEDAPPPDPPLPPPPPKPRRPLTAIEELLHLNPKDE